MFRKREMAKFSACGGLQNVKVSKNKLLKPAAGEKKIGYLGSGIFGKNPTDPLLVEQVLVEIDPSQCSRLEYSMVMNA